LAIFIKMDKKLRFDIVWKVLLLIVLIPALALMFKTMWWNENACQKEGFDFIGIELDEDYCNIANKRLKLWEEIYENGN